jgi:hypothetical protein
MVSIMPLGTALHGYSLSPLFGRHTCHLGICAVGDSGTSCGIHFSDESVENGVMQNSGTD